DVIEHIHDQARLLAQLQSLLNREGTVFLGFPPWQMPFGGHQQMCRTRWLSKLPYWHLLPLPLYRFILRRFKEPVADLLEVRQTRLSLEHFERLTKKTGYAIRQRRFYLLNPIYAYKFKLKERKQFRWLAALPWLRNFFTTCAYYQIAPASDSRSINMRKWVRLNSGEMISNQ
ncbi:MAG TPA: hypothetical protein VHK91_10650, partial [Flavisolibacter sp.]|nr:hypothetical protein [Flavisolibacter sp.]